MAWQLGTPRNPPFTATRAAAESTSPTPLLDALKQQQNQNVAAFHFPGHGRGASAPHSIAALLGQSVFQLDLPELPGLDNLHTPQAAIAQAQQMAADLFGADSTWFLVNGSSCGIHAAVMSCCNPGDHLILPRNCHTSAVSAMIFSGALPHFLLPAYDSEWEICHGVSAKSVQAAIDELRLQQKNVRIGAVLVVSPTYFGVCSSIRDIAEVCHRHGIPLIVDEAHGAHFLFHEDFPATALEQGADIVVQSTHKVLSSLTQSAMLHLGKGSEGLLVNREKMSRCLRALQTSSPSYLLMASLDSARAQLSGFGKGRKQENHPLFHQALQLASEARSSLQAIAGVAVLDQQDIDSEVQGEIFMDRLRITVGLWGLGVTGTEADDFLCEEHKVIAELPSLNSITFAVNTGNSSSDVQKLVAAFQALSSSRSGSLRKTQEARTSAWEIQVMKERTRVLSPRDAFYADSYQLWWEDAVGRPSAEVICPYPPGIPVLFPGELISKEAVTYLQRACAAGVTISGASDSSLLTFLVCKL